LVEENSTDEAAGCPSRQSGNEYRSYRRRALAIDEKALGPEHPDVAI